MTNSERFCLYIMMHTVNKQPYETLHALHNQLKTALFFGGWDYYSMRDMENAKTVCHSVTILPIFAKDWKTGKSKGIHSKFHSQVKFI